MARRVTVLDRVHPAHLLALALVGAGLVIALAPPADPDVWWHVRTGDLILNTHRLPGTDPWSLVAHGRRWITHEWLAEVVIALFHRAFGLHGLSLFRSLGVTALLGALAVQCFRRTTPYRAVGCLALAFFATSGGWGERPQLISFVLLVPVAQLVRQAAAGRANPWWLVPITWLWANLHGFWVLALALLGLAILGLLLEQGWQAGRDRAARLTTVAICCLAAAALTPNGPALVLEPVRIRPYGRFVSEWDPPTIHSTFGLAFFAMVALLLVLLARGERRLRPYALLQVLFAVALGLMYIRTVAPAAVLLTPLLADVLGRPEGTARRRALARPAAAAFLATIAGLVVAGTAFAFAAYPSLPPGAPVRATAALLASAPAPQRVLDEYGIGGWLLGRAPTVRPAIDGRTEIYPLTYVADYLNALHMVGDWRATILPLDANAALLHPDTPLVNGLRDELHWRTVYSDDTWVVLVPPTAVRAGAP